MQSTILGHNLAALRASGVAFPLERVLAADDGEVVRAAHRLDVQLRTAGGLVALDPGPDPVAAAAGTFPPTIDSASLIVVVGGGAGHAIEALLQRSVRGRILVVEPSPASCRAALSHRDWSPLIAANRLRWLVGGEYEGWLDSWSWVTPGDVPAIVIHPVLARVRTADVRRALDIVKDLVANAAANERARRRFAGPYLSNTLQNLPRLLASTDAGVLFGQFSGVPAVVAGAGPSLDDALPSLRGEAGKVLVITTDTALKPLLAAAATPDIVVGVDPSELNARHLTGLPELPGTYLVGEPSLHPLAFSGFQGRTLTFRVSDHHPWPWLAQHGVTRATLLAWGSVLTTAFDLAVQMGCDPILLTGADLAYTRGVLYCRNTAYEPEWAHLPTDASRAEEFLPYLLEQGAVHAPDMQGNPVLTAPRFVQFRDWMVRRIAALQGARRIVNCSAAGILHGPGVLQATLAEALSGRGDTAGRALLQRLARSGGAPAGSSHAQVAAMRTALAGVEDEGTLAAWQAFGGDGLSMDRLRASIRSTSARLSGPSPVGAPATAADWPVLASFTDVGAHARIIVVGAGRQARAFTRRLVASRDDVSVLCMIDAHPGGIVDGHQVEGPGRLDDTDYDCAVVIAPDAAPFIDSVAPSLHPAVTAVASADLREVDDMQPYTWLDQVLPAMNIGKPVLVLGGAASAARVPQDVHHTHFVISVNPGSSPPAWADLLVFVNAEQLLHALFTPGRAEAWGRCLVPDGMVKPPHTGVAPHLHPYLGALEPLRDEARIAWGWDRLVPSELIDEALDLAWARHRLVFYSLHNIYSDWRTHPDWPHIDGALDAFRPERMTDRRVLKSACNSVHVALSFLHHAGVRDVMMAGFDEQDAGRAAITRRVMERLDLRCRRVEDMTPAESARVFAPERPGPS